MLLRHFDTVSLETQITAFITVTKNPDNSD